MEGDHVLCHEATVRVQGGESHTANGGVGGLGLREPGSTTTPIRWETPSQNNVAGVRQVDLETDVDFTPGT